MKLNLDQPTVKKCAQRWSAAIFAALFASSGLHAQTFSGTATGNATVQTGGPRTGFNGTNFFNIQASSTVTSLNASFGVLDFSAASFGIAFPVTSVNTLSLKLTESNTVSANTTTAPIGLAFYITSDTTTSISNAAGASPLMYDTSAAPGGLASQLATTTAIGTGAFTSSGASNTGQVDTYTLTLNGTASSLIQDALNNGGTIRLVLTATSIGAATYAGVTNSNASYRPVLNIGVTLQQPSYTWFGGSENWDNANTNWRDGNTPVVWDSSANARQAVFSTGSGTVTITDSVTANAMRFDVDGYTVASAASKTLSLSTATGGNVIGVSTAGQTATISATISGTAGLEKNGAGTLILSGANDFTGDVKVSGGNLQVSADAALGAASNGVVLNTGTLKTLSALTLGSGRTLTGAGTISAAAGTTLTVSGPLAAGALIFADTGNVVFNGAGSFTGASVAAGATVTFNGQLSSTTKTALSGDGTIVLATDNSTQSGGFSFGKGSGTAGPTVIIGNAFSLGNGGSGSTLNLNAGTLQASTALTGANAIVTLVSLGGSATLAGADMDFTGGWGFFNAVVKTLTVNNNTRINGTIASNATATINTALVKAGTGTLTLAGANTYTGGTQVLAGKIVVIAGSNLGTGDVSVAATATANTILELDGSSSISDTANVILSSLSGFYGRIFLNFSASELETVNSLTVNGTSIAPGDYSFAANNLPNYLTGTGVLRVLAVVPEPSTALLLGGCGLAGLLGRRRVRA